MPNLSVTVTEAGRALGLQVTPTTALPLDLPMAYGLKDGYPVQLARGHDEGQERRHDRSLRRPGARRGRARCGGEIAHAP